MLVCLLKLCVGPAGCACVGGWICCSTRTVVQGLWLKVRREEMEECLGFRTYSVQMFFVWGRGG